MSGRQPYPSSAMQHLSQLLLSTCQPPNLNDLYSRTVPQIQFLIIIESNLFAKDDMKLESKRFELRKVRRVKQEERISTVLEQLFDPSYFFRSKIVSRAEN